MRATIGRQMQLWLFALVVLTLEGISYLGLWLLPRMVGVQTTRTVTILRDQTRRAQEYLAGARRGRDEVDSILGWHYRAAYVNGGDRINAQQLRSLREYERRPRQSVVRVAAFGDSFVYGNEVDTKDAWPSAAERIYPNLEVLNYGVGGYGDDQAYLRFAEEGLAFSPSVVVLGFTPDDMRRLTNVYRRFIDEREFTWTKPRFFLTNGGTLRYVPPPLRDRAGLARLATDPRMALGFGEFDQWFDRSAYENPLYDYSATVRLLTVVWSRFYNRFIDRNRLLAGSEFNPSSEAFRLQLAISAKFVHEAQRAGTMPLLLMLPDHFSIQQARRGRRYVYAGLVDSLRARGLTVIDPMSEFLARARDTAPEAWFAAGGHYSPLGNEVIGRIVGREVLDAVARRN